MPAVPGGGFVSYTEVQGYRYDIDTIGAVVTAAAGDGDHRPVVAGSRRDSIHLRSCVIAPQTRTSSAPAYTRKPRTAKNSTNNPDNPRSHQRRGRPVEWWGFSQALALFPALCELGLW